MAIKNKMTSKDYINMEKKYAANNYAPLDVVFEKAKGVEVWDPEGKKYYDFLAAYSAVNQGHGHKRLINTMMEQVEKCALTSRAFYNTELGKYAKFITNYFGYDKVLPMNTGAEAVETAIKIARRWGYRSKGIEKDEAIVLTCSANFHGRTIGVISFSTDNEARSDFGPFTPGMLNVKYNSLEALETILERIGSRVAGFLVEPIQGEAGVVVPDEGYLAGAKALCEKHNVLFIADEIQSGLGRAGTKLAVDHEGIKPDMVLLGKALSGGIYPVSAVLADDNVMKYITPGSHGSTYGGNPVGCAVAVEALKILEEEKLIDNSKELGSYFREGIRELISDDGVVKTVRGRGLFNAMVVRSTHKSLNGESAYALVKAFKENGLLAKQTHDHIIRFAPPLNINKQQVDECINIIKKTVKSFED
eukprot:CAMPEP_0117428240 /NCGR_PEP_ID=MMETSP0758-20121206/7993_1 /TAXON_ID=63605 /ORGANISM="Percolomonas cosmopolitus, Strain AE-1 (ATCC 50343)" /LENGTH=418 /DNA_ID=CAMNT_0005214489 /DNA_START=102 /DNA_END=1355 /DNA_ORIENTATION=-